MSESNSSVRLEVAFEGGQIGRRQRLAGGRGRARCGARRLRRGLRARTEDGTYVLALGKVVYVRRSGRETQIGFAATA